MENINTLKMLSLPHVSSWLVPKLFNATREAEQTREYQGAFIIGYIPYQDC